MKTSVLWISEQSSGLMDPSGTKPGVQLPDRIQGTLLNVNSLINYKFKQLLVCVSVVLPVIHTHTHIFLVYLQS